MICNIENQFDPTSCISGKIMRINRATANIFRKYLRPYDITDSQLSILFILTKKGTATQKKIATIGRYEKSTLNRNLKRLLEKNYLTREHFPQIEITEEGRNFVTQIIPEWEKAMQEIRKILGEDGEEALNTVLAKITR